MSVHLDSLNPQQREAVLFDPKSSLQILASPGTGKTKTLTSRVAYLVQHHGIPAKNIIVVTFANKAANEMKNRLRAMMGDAQVSQLKIGTFHALCVRYLRRSGTLIDLPNNFVISDASDSLNIIKDALKQPEIQGLCSEQGIDVPKAKQVQERISKAKAKGWSPGAMARQASAKHDKLDIVVSDIYAAYQAELKRSNALDFDDLLVQGLRLFKKFPLVFSSIQAVLIDEWQDTNTTQYEIAKQLASKCRALTVVGDPDQSIYGWRSAETENIDRMVKDFKPVHQLLLEENYRSTGAILAASSAVINQDKSRIKKDLRTSQDKGQRVVFRQLPSAPEEASYVANEIKRLIAYSGNALTYADFAILLRYNALSRSLEQALQKSGIPSRVLGGSKFFDRIEVRDILAMLQLVDNPGYDPAFDRVINSPKRGIGNQTLDAIKADARKLNCSQLEIVTRALKGQNVGSIKPAQKKALKPFVSALGTLKQRAEAGAEVPELITAAIDLIDYESFMIRTFGPDETTSRMQNLEELKSFAVQVSKDNAELLAANAETDDQTTPETDYPEATQASQFSQHEEAATSDDFEDAIGILKQTSQGDKAQTPLRVFLAASMLSTDTEDKSKEDQSNRVTISTVHSAKGSEWPCVFVCAVEEGTIPFYKCTEQHEIDEERRLLFVAMTRAQISLHVTCAAARMRGTNNDTKRLSRFIERIASPDQGVFVQSADAFNAAKRSIMWSLLRRPPVSEEEVEAIVTEYKKKSLPAQQAYQASGGIQVRTQPSGYRGYSSNRGYQSASQALRASQGSAPQSFNSSQGFQSSSQAFPGASQSFRAARSGIPSQPARKVTLAAAETRLSRIDDATLLNPRAPTSLGAPTPTLSSFQTTSQQNLSQLKNLGKRGGGQASDAPTKKKPKL